MTRKKLDQEKDQENPGYVPDHPDQAYDTPLPGDDVNEEAFKALQDQYEGDPEDG